MNITVIGTGYVGLVTGVCLADIGHNVICVDNNKNKIELLKKGKSPIYESGLEELIKKNIDHGQLSFSTDLEQPVKKSDVIFIAVGTYPLPDGSADLSQVENVAKSIAPFIDTYKVVVNKSTVPPKTADLVKNIILKIKPDANFDIISNPEFLREGSAVLDTMQPDRVTVGGDSKKALDVIKKIYAPIVKKSECTYFETGTIEAELIKYTANAFLATKISYINAVSNICDSLNADITEVSKGIGLDHRIGKIHLNAGIGYGGSCFPKDVDAFINIAEQADYNFNLLKEVRRINNVQVARFVEKVLKRFEGDLSGMNICVFGLSFKPDTDDLREAPSVKIINILTKNGAKIAAYDPIVKKEFKKYSPNTQIMDSSFEAAKDTDAILILTEWDEFITLDYGEIKKTVKNAVIFDGRNCLDRENIIKLGFEYYGVGR